MNNCTYVLFAVIFLMSFQTSIAQITTPSEISNDMLSGYYTTFCEDNQGCYYTLNESSDVFKYDIDGEV